MDRHETLRRITEGVVELPTLPTVVTEMISLVNNPRTTAADLARLISTDQALTAKILKLVNSAFYGFPRKIGTVNLAIVILGFETVKNLTLSLSLIKQLFSDADDTLFNHRKFWEHSVGCAVAGRFLAERLRYRTNGEAFAAGILHDIGKLVLSQYFQEELVQIIDLTRRKEIFMYEAEDAVIGVTHAEIGGQLADSWNLPSRLVHAITFHHHPWDAPKDRELAGVVHLANVLCQRMRIGDSGDPRALVMSDEIREMFRDTGVPLSDEEQILRIGEEIRAELRKAEHLAGLIGPEAEEDDFE